MTKPVPRGVDPMVPLMSSSARVKLVAVPTLIISKSSRESTRFRSVELKSVMAKIKFYKILKNIAKFIKR